MINPPHCSMYYHHRLHAYIEEAVTHLVYCPVFIIAMQQATDA